MTEVGAPGVAIGFGLGFGFGLGVGSGAGAGRGVCPATGCTTPPAVAVGWTVEIGA